MKFWSNVSSRINIGHNKSMKKGNLLIVDDEILIVKRLKIILSDLADEVFTAFDGEEALTILQSQKINCIICDINMPRMDGMELIKKLRTFDTKLPFIFYTSHGHQELMREAAQSNAFDFLNKPHITGIEEVIERGLHLGLTGELLPPKEGGFESAYQKFLKTI